MIPYTDMMAQRCGATNDFGVLVHRSDVSYKDAQGKATVCHALGPDSGWERGDTIDGFLTASWEGLINQFYFPSNPSPRCNAKPSPTVNPSEGQPVGGRMIDRDHAVSAKVLP